MSVSLTGKYMMKTINYRMIRSHFLYHLSYVSYPQFKRISETQSNTSHMAEKCMVTEQMQRLNTILKHLYLRQHYSLGRLRFPCAMYYFYSSSASPREPLEMNDLWNVLMSGNNFQFITPQQVIDPQTISTKKGQYCFTSKDRLVQRQELTRTRYSRWLP